MLSTKVELTKGIGTTKELAPYSAEEHSSHITNAINLGMADLEDANHIT